jgi:hypothetical protein
LVRKKSVDGNWDPQYPHRQFCVLSRLQGYRRE